MKMRKEISQMCFAGMFMICAIALGGFPEVRDATGIHPYSSSDSDLARRIREELVQDKGLSLYAQNIAIVTDNGAVVLKGPVRSLDEKIRVEGKAKWIAGDRPVISELQVAR